MNLKKSIFLLMLLAPFHFSFAGDSLRVSSFNSFNLLKANNAWLNTGNVAGLVYNQPRQVILFNTGYDFGNGDFHRIREAGTYHNYSFDTESYESIKGKLFLYGKFAYHYLDEDGAKWNGTYDAYNGNPYTLADTVSNTTFHKENYNLNGKIGYQFSDRLAIGFGIDYFAAIGAKQKDPRPEITLVKLSFNPSLIYKASNYTVGLDLGYTNRKEETDYDVLKSSFSPTFFMFKGMGFYSKQISSSYYRFLSADNLFGGIQYEKSIKGISTLSELRFNYNLEEIEDGSSIIKKEDGGEWETYTINFNEQIALKTQLVRHYIKGAFSFFNGDGKEFTQEVQYLGTWNVPRYITIGKNLKFNRQVMEGTISYNYQLLNSEEQINWDIISSIRFINNKEKYYYVPEIFNSSYSNVTSNLSIQKNLYHHGFHIASGLNLSCNSNLSNDIMLSSLTEITKKQAQNVYLQEFDYYTSSFYKVGGEIKIGTQNHRLKSKGQAYISLRYDHCKPTNGNNNFDLISTKIGFTF